MLVVGAGISGGACSSALHARGVDVVVREAAQVPGGRGNIRDLRNRFVDVGAAYFTVTDAEFASVVDGWTARGMVRPWTDTFDVFAGTERSQRSGPQRWLATEGLRTLAADLMPVPVEFGVAVSAADVMADDSGYDAVVLAMPDPQAARIIDDLDDVVDYEPVITVVAGFDRHEWDLAAAAFVNDDPNVTLIVDDGSRHGDSAAVLVAHSTSDLAREHLDHPDAVVSPVLASVRRLLGIAGAPAWTDVSVWREAKPAGTHGEQPFGLDGRIGRCGDSWCPSGSPRIEAAWLSGHRLGVELADRLT